MPSGIYHGRLATDGVGNLLADDPENPSVHGLPVAYHDGSYIFVQPGEPSHNQRHHQAFAFIDGTRDADTIERMLQDIPESDPDRDLLVQYWQNKINAGGGENMHHFETQEDDPHYDADAPNKTTLKNNPDALAAKVTSHTDAYQNEDQ